ncbi:hypothetical protein EASAB2608_06580 [Streptomyces sp. EAS-AB2608]|nr:hypothetical protein EASAB2608_06580 [Streptomyces sp. EAS-AB2608]
MRLVPVNDQQLAEFVSTHEWRIPFDTSPRHLAGPGDARHVTHGLAAAGWKRTSDPLSPRIVLTSPDHRYRLDFSPQSDSSAWWALWAEYTDTERGWNAVFGELVPAEILGSFTDALLSPPPLRQISPFEVLDAAGWLIDSRGRASSPDVACHVERHAVGRGDSMVSWHVEVSDPDQPRLHRRRIWQAHFDSNTPGHLVTAFVAALADPAPLQRGMHDRTAHHSVTQHHSAVTPKQIIEAHKARLTAIRARASAARRKNNKPTTNPATSTATRPAVHR